MSGIPSRAYNQRVLVSIDLHTQGLLDIAAEIAALLQIELQALFIENDDLLRLAGLPGFHEIGLTTSTPRALSVESMQRTLRAQAERARQSLAAVAERRQLSWSFRVERGPFARTSLESTTDTDVLVIGRIPNPAIRPPAAQRATGPLVVIYDGSDPSRRALRMAGELAQASHAEMVILPVNGTVSDVASLIHRIHADLMGLPRNTRVERRAVSSCEALIGIVSGLRAQSIWLGFPCALLDLPTVDRLIAHLPCPIIIVR